jgi:hypothetical protein
MEVPAKLLALAASVSWDGGDGVLRTLRQILREDAPFDAGEVALSRSPGFQRWTLTDDEREVAADDLLEGAASGDSPIRIDDAQEPGFAPRTRQHMAERGLRSCLALPLGGAGGPEGAIVVAREHGWAFTGVSLHTLWPVASMAGLCLARAIALTALKRDADSLRAASRTEEEGLRHRLAAAEGEVLALRRAAGHAEEQRSAAAASAQSAEDRVREAASELEALYAECEGRRREAEGLAAALREAQGLAEGRTAELASAILKIAELDRLLGLAPPPPARRRRRSRGTALGAAPASSPGDEPGPASES